MKSILSGIASLIIPGLGQLMHGHVTSAIIWFVVAMIAGPIVNIFSAIHALTLGSGSRCRC